VEKEEVIDAGMMRRSGYAFSLLIVYNQVLFKYIGTTMPLRLKE
jgi:hypothetical protein